TGGIFSLSFFSTPALLLAPSSTSQPQWSYIYTLGKRTMPVLALATSSLYIYLSRVPHTYASLPPSIAWRTKPALYLASAALTVSIVPYTILFMRSNITSLERAGEDGKPGERKSVKGLIDTWGTLNLGRAVLTGMGFGVGLWATLL
ncbi:hypothetical protein BDZ91DRAFT_662148, partial [Kalaharituber pfeilii]